MNKDALVRITALDKTKEAFQSLRGNLQNVERQVSTVRGRLEAMQPAFQKMTVIGGAAFAGVAFGIKNATQNAVELGESVNAVNVVFGDGASRILAFGENAATSVGLANSEFNQMSTVTGALLKDTGKSMDEVADMTIDLTKRAADMASVFNTDVNDALSAINQAIRGETEAIRRYAGDVTDATINQYLLSQGMDQTTADMTEQEKRLARIQVIMAQTDVTANDFANTSDSLANQQRILSAQFKDMSAQLGEQLIPVFQKVLSAIRPVIDRVAAWIEANPELSSKLLLVAAAVSGLVVVVGALGIALFAITSPIGLVVVAIGAISGAVYFLIKAFKNFKEMFPGVIEGAKSVLTSFANFFIGIAEGIANSWVDSVNTIIKALNTIQVSIPDWVPKVGGKSFGIDLPTIPEVKLPRLATGGVVTRPTIAEIGEAGPEAVIPLDRMGQMGGNTYNLYLSGTFLDDRAAARRMGDEIMRTLKQQARL